SKHDPDVHYAGILAAKEAVYKAIGLSWTGAFSWRWIEITRGESAAPTVRLDSRLQRSHKPPTGESPPGVTVSISHAGDYAVAVAAILGA
ncbi:MAG: 4'-phosphopantetheinyl transferase superfamily protein, partial [Spirochaetaceae bacterium]|nr:4'-phosphopantetheinyl transferase superfamily protein [Spirochaetaceae bacterium]